MARPSFARLVRLFRSLERTYTPEALAERLQVIDALRAMPFGSVAAVTSYHDALLFTAAYPGSDAVRRSANEELHRIATYVAALPPMQRLRFRNRGIAGAPVHAALSLAINRWLVQRAPNDVVLSTENVNESVLVQTLNHLFDPVEQEMLHAGKTAWGYWSEHMTGTGGDPHRLKRWLVTMVDRLEGSTAMKEFVFGQFSITTEWNTSADAPSLTTGRVDQVKPYIHNEGLVRVTDLADHLQRPPRRVDLALSDKRRLVDLARGVLTTLQRETDPVTHAHIPETELYDMGRGLGIALFAMKPDMKMALQSYIGFLVVKNGVPCAYGGGWILNDESFFGVNVFPPFRGGESVRIVADLLRCYRHTFGVRAFCVDPYQIGYGNPDGIRSRSFWFYYRLGFRPLERPLARLAAEEFRRMRRDAAYRTDERTLKRLAESTMRWVVPNARASRGVDSMPITADRVGDLVTVFVRDHYEGDRQRALVAAVRVLSRRSGRRVSVRHPVARVAVVLHACGFSDTASPATLRAVIDDYAIKMHDERAYIRRVRKHTALFKAIAAAERALAP